MHKLSAIATSQPLTWPSNLAACKKKSFRLVTGLLWLMKFYLLRTTDKPSQWHSCLKKASEAYNFFFTLLYTLLMIKYPCKIHVTEFKMANAWLQILDINDLLITLLICSSLTLSL